MQFGTGLNTAVSLPACARQDTSKRRPGQYRKRHTCTKHKMFLPGSTDMLRASLTAFFFLISSLLSWLVSFLIGLHCQSIGTVGQDRTVISINMFLHSFCFIPLYLSRLSHRVKEHSIIRGFSMGQYRGQRGGHYGTITFQQRCRPYDDVYCRPTFSTVFSPSIICPISRESFWLGS